MGEDCQTGEYRKFKREFDIWSNAAYLEGYETQEMWGTLNSRLDAGWQERMLGIEGIEKKALPLIWKEIDIIMKSLYPTHSRRIKFLAMKPTKGQAPSNFIQKMKEEALDASIKDLTESSLILHLTTAGL